MANETTATCFRRRDHTMDLVTALPQQHTASIGRMHTPRRAKTQNCAARQGRAVTQGNGARPTRTQISVTSPPRVPTSQTGDAPRPRTRTPAGILHTYKRGPGQGKQGPTRSVARLRFETRNARPPRGAQRSAFNQPDPQHPQSHRHPRGPRRSEHPQTHQSIEPRTTTA